MHFLLQFLSPVLWETYRLYVEHIFTDLLEYHSLLGSGFWVPVMFFRNIDDCTWLSSYERVLLGSEPKVLRVQVYVERYWDSMLLLVIFGLIGLYICWYTQVGLYIISTVHEHSAVHEQFFVDLLEDVKSSFDSMNTKECIFFDWKKRRSKDSM